jgi:hypothetical protein
MGEKKSLDERQKEKAEAIIKELRDKQSVGEATEADINAQKKANKQLLGHEGE